MLNKKYLNFQIEQWPNPGLVNALSNFVLILYAMHFNCAEVQLKIYWSVFEYAKR